MLAPFASLLAQSPSRGDRPTRCTTASVGAADDSLTRASHTFIVERTWLTMRDGVRLAASVFRPVPRRDDERFPALLELLPYRKDDSFYRRDYPIYAYFACRGFLTVKVDIRGTGGSEGAVPEREYSDAELDDAADIIAQLAVRPDGNGSVGMWGISWGGFNAIQVAMRHPPALKAILALHASDDLYFDDVRYNDGTLHIDPYALQIDHENALPRSPDYALDSSFFKDRFDRRPWLFEYLEQPTDGEFWRRGSLRFQYDALRIPAYFIGGLLDGYRDTPLRALILSTAPVKVEIGPWQHDWPDDGNPGPNYEWRERAVRWWRKWLQGMESGITAEPPLLAFVRDAVAPNEHLTSTPGSWRFAGWPPSSPTSMWYALPGRRLAMAPSGLSAADTLRHVAGLGAAAGVWWGDPTGDMRPDDRDGLVYDSPALSDTLRILGFPSVRLRLRSGMARAHWSVRLEDVWPDGRVSLVTGKLLNGMLRRDRLSPAPLDPDEWFDVALDLHFTTWTFRPGHRVRLLVSHAQFPMAWPSPYPGVSELVVGSAATSLSLSLPTLDWSSTRNAVLPPSQGRMTRPDTKVLSSSAPPARVTRDAKRGTTTVIFQNRSRQRLGDVTIAYSERETYRASALEPSRAAFLGEARHSIRRGERVVALVTTITIRSDADSLHVVFRRRISENGRPVRERTWDERLPRAIH